MLNLIATLILINLLRAFVTAEPVEIQNSFVKTEEQAAKLFVEIQSKQVLPLIFSKTSPEGYGSSSDGNELRFPQKLDMAVTLNGRIVQGTNFSNNQIFFCPDKTSEKKCLVPETIEELGPLECAEEPDPVLQDDTVEDLCGPEYTGVPYEMAYKICPNKEEYATEDIPIYTLCYHTGKKKTLYTIHTIMSPLLLKSNLLYRERTVPYQYQFTENEALKPLNFAGVNYAPNTDLNLLTHPNNPNYRIQKLVPDTDMAFASWRKTTYRDVNLDWQHFKLIPLWNEINNYVKSKAIQMIDENTIIKVQTAVFDIVTDTESPDDAKILNIWIKVVTTKPSKPLTRPRGIAILMNNFTVGTAGDSITSSHKIDEIIETFCEEDFCVERLIDNFVNVGGMVRCCSITEKVGEVFGLQDIKINMPILHIEDVTSELSNSP